MGGTEHTMLPDMIEIGSWIGLAAMTKSELTIKNVSWDDLGVIPNVFGKLGITIERKGEDIFIPAHTDGYEIQNYIDGSIFNHFGCPVARVYARFTKHYSGGCNTGKRECSHPSKNV